MGLPFRDGRWANVFTDSVSLKQAVGHFASYAHANGWTEMQYLHFMSYNPNLNKILPLEVYKKGPVHGIGHWLVTNSMFPRDDGGVAYDALVRSSFHHEGQQKEKGKTE